MMEPDPSNINFVQFGTIIFAILVIYEQIKLYQIDKANWKRALNASAWAVHVLIFYLLIYLDSIDLINFHELFVNPLFFTEWSPYLRLHSGIAFYFIVRSNRTFVTISNKTKSIIEKYTMQHEGTNEQ